VPSSIAEICIVGAGIAGLRCADILLQYGFKVTLLEARDRIGGRVHHATLPSGQVVDLGPNWIHGTDHNPIMDLAKETHTISHTWEGKLNLFSENGHAVKNAQELDDAFWGIVAQAFKYSAENTSIIDPEKSLYDFFAEKVNEIHPEAEARKTLMQMSEMWGAYVSHVLGETFPISYCYKRLKILTPKFWIFLILNL
jgi:monoamine oxidase